MNYSGDKPVVGPGRIAYLIDGFLRDTLTGVEHEELDNWIEASPENMRLFEELTDEKEIEAVQVWYRKQEAKKASNDERYRMIREKTVGKGRSSNNYLITASIIGLGVVLYFIVNQFFMHKQPSVAQMQNRNQSIGNRPVLILANGRTVFLDSAQEMVAEGITITDGQIRHKKQVVSDTGYNTIRVPAGKQFNLSMSDGSVVWLNAGSVFRYPASFAMNARRVALTGEAFFEVSHDAKRAFMVTSAGQEVTVLGTRFNVRAYTVDKPITTLVQGAVQVSANGMSKQLVPGQQSIVDSKGINVRKADLEETVAWKSGYFIFRSATIETIAEQLAQWYGVEIMIIEKPSEHFNASIPRTESLARALEVLEGSGYVHFTQKGNTLYIRR